MTLCVWSVSQNESVRCVVAQVGNRRTIARQARRSMAVVPPHQL
ncbi:hypothetical protein [Zarconia navalis]|nr:hypothetical protein [Zarconia navalis]